MEDERHAQYIQSVLRRCQRYMLHRRGEAEADSLLVEIDTALRGASRWEFHEFGELFPEASTCTDVDDQQSDGEEIASA